MLGQSRGLNRPKLAPGLATAPSRVLPGPQQENLPLASQFVFKLKADFHKGKRTLIIFHLLTLRNLPPLSKSGGRSHLVKLIDELCRKHRTGQSAGSACSGPFGMKLYPRCLMSHRGGSISAALLNTHLSGAFWVISVSEIFMTKHESNKGSI